jgi:hypothetical protein
VACNHNTAFGRPFFSQQLNRVTVGRAGFGQMYKGRLYQNREM